MKIYDKRTILCGLKGRDDKKNILAITFMVF